MTVLIYILKKIANLQVLGSTTVYLDEWVTHGCCRAVDSPLRSFLVGHSFHPFLLSCRLSTVT